MLAAVAEMEEQEQTGFHLEHLMLVAEEDRQLILQLVKVRLEALMEQQITAQTVPMQQQIQAQEAEELEIQEGLQEQEVLE